MYILSIILLGLSLSPTTIIAQDLECVTPALCNQIILTHSVQIKTHCVYLNILFRNMSEETLNVGIFRLCRRTLILDMSNNQIRLIKAGAFLGLSSLRQLYLANNLIEMIEPGTFHTLTNLEVFVLTGNKLTTIPEYEFTSKSMRYFNINHNNIHKLPDTALLNLANIDLVDLSLNKLDIINPYALSNVKPGAKIILSNNNLMNVSMFFNVTSRSTKLSILEASGNILKVLNKYALGDYYKLQLSALDLGFNFISDIDVTTFDNYTSLRALYLSHNRIKTIHSELFKELVNLNTLDLSYNQLTHQVFLLKLPETMMNVNYSNNAIGHFVDYHWSSKMKRKPITLDISNNSLTYIDPNRLCQFVERVNLAYNKWTCSVLYNVLRNMEMRGIHVVHGMDYTRDNINGIPCTMEVSKLLDTKLEEIRTVLNKVENVTTEIPTTTLEDVDDILEQDTPIDETFLEDELMRYQQEFVDSKSSSTKLSFILIVMTFIYNVI